MNIPKHGAVEMSHSRGHFHMSRGENSGGAISLSRLQPACDSVMWQ